MIAQIRRRVAQRYNLRMGCWIIAGQRLIETAPDYPGILYHNRANRDFAAAEKHLRQIRDQIREDGIPFSAAALQHSEDPLTSTRGGAAGWHRQTSQFPSPEVIQAAFALNRDDISEPIRTGEGYYLVKVVDIEPMPDDAHLIKSLRRVLEVQLRQRILEQAQIELL